MSTVKVLLTHVCNMPAHPGLPGQVVEGVDEELAERWETKGGCQIVSDDTPTFAETQTKAPAKAKAPAAPAAGGQRPGPAKKDQAEAKSE